MSDIFEKNMLVGSENQVKAADVLGINRNTLRKKISELKIEMKRG